MTLALPNPSALSVREQGKLIVGGVPAAPGDFPYIVSLADSKDGYYFCGGSLLNNNTILTAGHCAFNIDPRGVQVRLGSLVSRDEPCVLTNYFASSG